MRLNVYIWKDTDPLAFADAVTIIENFRDLTRTVLPAAASSSARFIIETEKPVRLTNIRPIFNLVDYGPGNCPDRLGTRDKGHMRAIELDLVIGLVPPPAR